MSRFDDKEKAGEHKYALDQEMEFKINARAHRLLGLWAAGKMGLAGAQAEEYAQSLVTIDLEKADRQHFFHKLKTDLLAHDVHMTDHDIHLQVHQFQHLAKEQVEKFGQ